VAADAGLGGCEREDALGCCRRDGGGGEFARQEREKGCGCGDLGNLGL
jgi:hypothetical protein